MKITKIELVNFRGFPGTAVYDFEFGNASNLFVYGENGSGKSSLFLALQEFFNNRSGATPFSDFKNSSDPSNVAGRVAIHFDEGSQHTWADGGGRPVSASPVTQAARQVGCFDYRSLLETNFTHKTGVVNLFSIAVDTLVPHMEVPVAGRMERIDVLWQRVRATKPRNHRGRNIQTSENALVRFNDGFEPIVTPLITKATELLASYFDPQLSLAAAFQRVRYNQTSRRFDNTELILSVRRDGAELLRHHNLLNEARLSAIGLVIYLSGLLISVPANSAFPKLLVLDDVLVGLDMGNRVPVLRILKQEFADWQIVLLTHDRIWYEMVLTDGDAATWQAYELWLADDGSTPIHKKRESGPDFFLGKARSHLANNDDRAAGMYTRVAFETRVKKYCEEKGVPVRYFREPKRLSIDQAWTPAKVKALEQAEATRRPVLEQLFAAVTRAQRVILNPLSHSIPQTLTRIEIEAAINAVEALRFE